MLTWIAREEFSTVAAMIAPCSVKADGNTGENLSLARWSQFATTSAFSSAVSRNIKWAGKRSRLRLTCSLSRFVDILRCQIGTLKIGTLAERKVGQARRRIYQV